MLVDRSAVLLIRMKVVGIVKAGYDGVLSIEHEDRSFEGDLDTVKRGFLLARDVLSAYVK